MYKFESKIRYSELDEKGYLVDSPKAVFRMVRECLLSGQLLGEHTERIPMATPAASNL